MMSRKRNMFSSLFVLSLVSLTLASKCEDLSGNWQNELGSRMLLNVSSNGRITGQYWTAVETSPGAAAFVSNLTGVFSKQKDGALVAFSVFFNHGISLATWVGQCLICEGQEILHTTYVLRTFVSDPKQKWRSVIVNQNTFTRSDNTEVNSIIPSQVATSNVVSGIDGTWASSNNEEIEILRKEINSSGDISKLQINGKWKSSHTEEIPVSGISDATAGQHGLAHDSSKRTSLVVFAIENKRVRSWAGHIDDDTPSSKKLWETAWLDHEFSATCLTPRGNLIFGMTNFTQTSSDDEHTLMKSETFLEKLRKFFTSMF